MPEAPPIGSCPDPRYCDDYGTLGGHWVASNAGSVVLHYRVNATNPAPPQSTLNPKQIQQAIEAAAATWTAADPRIVFVDDGLTTDQPAFNSVIGFSAATQVGNTETQPTCNTCDTYSTWDMKLQASLPWTWKPCDPANGQPCTNYASDPGAGPDVQAIATHEFGHVLGLGHPSDTNAQDGELTMYGNTPRSCLSVQGDYGCRAKDTLGLGDIDGVRALYPTSAPKPPIYLP